MLLRGFASVSPALIPHEWMLQERLARFSMIYTGSDLRQKLEFNDVIEDLSHKKSREKKPFCLPRKQ